MTTKDFNGAADDEADVERLVQLGGPRRAPDPAARAPAREVMRGAWSEAVQGRVRRRRIARVVGGLAAAAALVVAVVLTRDSATVPAVEVARLVSGTVTVRSQDGSATRDVRPGDALMSGETVATAPPHLAALGLTGGGELRMNSATSVGLAAVRRFDLGTGQVYVDSGGVAGAALTIETPAGPVRDIGTRFEVRVEGTRVRVRVRDGAVRLSTAGVEVDAGPGKQLDASPGARPDVSSIATYGAEWNWIIRAAPFAIEGATLDDFIRWIEREDGRRVVFADPTLRQTVGAARLHGSVAGLTVEDALGIILPASGLTYDISGDRIIVRQEARAR
jgi:ferric-dicitrate binding protein FerR (iron transport regulator)